MPNGEYSILPWKRGFALFAAVVASLSFGLFLIPQNIRSADAATNCPASILGPSTVTYPDTPNRPGFILTIRHDEKQKEKAYFPNEHFVLRVLSRDWRAEILAEMKFSSSYERFELCLVDLSGDGVEEFVLITGEDHGTNVVTETFTVWKRTEKGVTPLLSVPVSGNFGTREWWYRREFVDVNGDGVTDLRMTLEHDPSEDSPVDNTKLIPKTRLMEFVFDRKKSRIVPYTPPH